MRIGVYFCACGMNISDKIDPEQVQAGALTVPQAAYFKKCEYLCSEEGKSFLQHDLETEEPDRVVVTACSPREYESTFRDCLAAGINPYLMQIVNLREQVAWVTADGRAATEKAVSYIRAAAARVSHQAPLEEKEIEINSSVLVIGAGPAGLKAANALAAAPRAKIASCANPPARRKGR